MAITIRALADDDIDAVVEFSVRAWKPVFESFAQVLGSRIYQRLYPDWLAGQAQAVAGVCRDEKSHVWVAEMDGRLAGFAAVVFHEAPTRGEIDMLAVDPECQRRGVADALITYAVERISESGAVLAEIGTGGDPGHAPARAAYEKAGFTALPLVRYYKAL